MSFAESMNQCLRRELPAFVTTLVCLAMLFSKYSNQESDPPTSLGFEKYRSNATESMSDYMLNNLLIGSPDPFFWFLVPIFGIISAGLCVAVNYVVLILTYILLIPVSYTRLILRSEEARFVLLHHLLESILIISEDETRVIHSQLPLPDNESLPLAFY
jgi:GPI inositol-deacylase